ncbi:MAG: tetratricopeptide repeat protein, partial [Hyphomicrobiaceae bacterium]
MAIPVAGLVLMGCQSSAGPSRARATIGGSNTQLLGAAHTSNIASLSAAVDRNPHDAHALNTRGSAFAEAGNFARAIEDFSAALRINPSYHQALANRA